MLLPAVLLLCSLSAWAAPIFDHERGLYDDPFTLRIDPEDSGATVLYSVDGSIPSLPWPGFLDVEGTTIVRAVEVAADGSSSAIATHSFFYLDDVIASPVMDATVASDPDDGPLLAATLAALPTVSIVSPATMSTTEQAVSLEWIDPDGDVVQADCGARYTGGHSLNYDKKSVRLYFRSDYGPGRLDLDLYQDFATGVAPASQHDKLNLRSGSHDSVFYLGSRGQYLRNRWMDESQLEMGHIVPHGRFAHLYLNGVYNGLYHVRERFDAAMMAEYLGGEDTDYEAVNAGTVVDGDGSAWAQVEALSSDYEAVQDWLNVENFVDYMILNFYAGNDWDWNPYQNWMAAGPNDAGQGGFVFHSSDSDICLYYDWDIDILDQPGPGYVFQGLREQWHPDFAVLLEDRIHALLEGDGTLTADAAAVRYARLADQIDAAVVAESARWGAGWWRRDTDWLVERDHLLDDWFPLRTAEQLRQFRAAGWYPLDAPGFDTDPGLVPAGTVVAVDLPADTSGDLWITTDGSDPRLPGGAVSAGADGPLTSATVALDRSRILSARVRVGEQWGPIEQRFFEVDALPPLVLNEWNAVDADELLDDDGADDAFGRIEGNGGDWIELLVIEDHLDLRGWRLELTDRRGDAGTLLFTDDPLLADLRSGTLLTVAEDLPEDPAYDPGGGDWRFHLRAGAEGSGRYVSASPFDVTHREWQLTAFDADGAVRFGPAGEGIAPESGIGSDEVGLLAADPDGLLRRSSSAYTDGNHSTFGAPNRWDGGQQDLSALRSVIDPVDTGAASDGGALDGGAFDGGARDGGASDSGTVSANTDTGEADAPDAPDAAARSGCGCAAGPGGGAGAWLLVPLFGLWRRRRVLPAVLLAACTGNTGAVDRAAPGAGDGGATDGSATDGGAPDGGMGDGGDTGSGTDCFVDADADGFGDPAAPVPCDQGVATSGDCDDSDPGVHPGAAEACNDVDDDCDGQVDDADDDVVDGLPFFVDGDGDGYGSDDGLVTACVLAEGLSLSGGDCDDADPGIHPDAEELCDEIDQDCDGTATDELGASPECAVDSCLAALDADPGADDGPRFISLTDGGVAYAWCDMHTDGGGWTAGFLRNSAHTGSQGDFGAGDQDPDRLDISPDEASDTSDPRMAWFDLNLFDWTELQISAHHLGAQTWRSDSIPRDALRLSFGEDGYRLYGGETGYYWCGGDASYTDSGVGAVDNPPGATSDCKGHGSLGSGWDFSTSTSANQGLTLCGGDGSALMSGSWGTADWVAFGAAGAAQALWVR